MIESKCTIKNYILIVFHTFLTLVVTYGTPTAGVGYREKTHLVKLNEVVVFRVQTSSDNYQKQQQNLMR
jgi:hypothetical protein